MNTLTKTKNHARRVERFLLNAAQKHGDIYDYSDTIVEYTTTRKQVHITCKQCGIVFTTLPQDHVSSHPHRKGGCPKCIQPAKFITRALEIRWSNNHTERIGNFLYRADEKHQGKYAYPHIEKEYRNEKSAVTVVCKKCKHNYITPARVHISPLRYSGCSVCNKEAMISKIVEKNHIRQTENYKSKDIHVPVGHIYKITNTVNRKFYIGYTTMSLKGRLKAHSDSSVRIGKKGFKSKSYLHNAMRKYGAKVFMIEAIETLYDISPVELGERETEMIIQLKPHYNLTNGGDIWGPCNTKPIVVSWYNETLNTKGTYRSLAYAARSVGGDPRQIKAACNSNQSYKNLQWSFLDDHDIAK